MVLIQSYRKVDSLPFEPAEILFVESWACRLLPPSRQRSGGLLEDKVKPEQAAAEESVSVRETNKKGRANEKKDFLKPSDDLLFDAIN